MATTGTGVVDYVIFGLLLLFSSCVGFFYAYRDRRNITMETYHLGNKDIAVLPVSVSLSVTILGAQTLLGLPAEVYSFGTMIFWTLLSMFLAMVIAAFTIVHVLYNLGKKAYFSTSVCVMDL